MNDINDKLLNISFL